MDISPFLVGKGYDVSKTQNITSSDKNTITHSYLPPDNFYRLDENNLDFIYGKNIINEGKYFRILLKEWFWALKKNGKIIIEYKEQPFFKKKIISTSELKKEINLLFGKNVKVIGEETNKKNHLLILNKEINGPYQQEEINHWTFGIITNGKKKEDVSRIITSINQLKIPKYEIIICGTYNEKIEENIKYIHFNENDDKGWITKKKNLICENARYENICILHDRIMLNKDWFEGMKRYKNNFEVLSCKIYCNNIRTYDWITTKYPYDDKRSNFYQGGYLEYSDWDKWIYVDGGAIIIKKDIWEKVKWDERLFWNQREDVKLSHEQTKRGILIRFNPYSSYESLTWRHPASKLIFKKNNLKLGKLKGPIPYVIGKKVIGYYLRTKTVFTKNSN